MNWLPITEADLLKTKLSPLIDALRSAALGGGQSDPVDEIRDDVIRWVRTKVASCSTNRLDADPTKVPASLKALACRMIVREAQSRLQLDLNDDERREADRDDRALDKVAGCNQVVEQPEIPIDSPVQPAQQRPSISGRRKQFSRGQQDGA